MHSAAVRFENVQKSYDGVQLVVKELNLDIASGEFLTILGPSGSGKSTCLTMLAGFETVTHGEIYLNDQPINHVPPNKRGIGMVFQNYALFPHMTIEENLLFPLQVRKIPADEAKKKVKRALSMVHLQDFAQRRPNFLSGGQQQRAAVARALVFDPSLILMDEPLGALDKQLRERMQYEIKKIHEQLGVTVVYVTHDQGEALTMSDRVAVFDKGIIQQLAPPKELYERPTSSFVAQFIGENNQIEGTVKEVSDNVCSVETTTGEIVKANPVNIDGVNKKSTLSIRPERVFIDGNKNDYDNNFTAKIKDLIFLGDHIRLMLSLFGNDEFIVKVPNADALDMNLVGSDMNVSWHSKDCHALDSLS